MAKFRKIGVLTSGGDAPGMDACVKAVVHRSIALGIEVVGINYGYAGLINNNLVPLTRKEVSNFMGESGTALYSSRCLEFKTEEGMAKAIRTCRENDIDALICIGGDGTFRGATDMTMRGIPSIGIPGTIDNDITATDYTIGFDTAINTTASMIDNLSETCESHARLNVVEVMGNHCGQLALYAAITSGAAACAIPELPFDEDAAIKHIMEMRQAGKRGMIVVVSEGVRNADGSPYSETLTEKIRTVTGIDTRFVRPAHIVRGGKPTVRDRSYATKFATCAVEALVAGQSNLVACHLDNTVRTVDISFALMVDRMYKNKLKPGDLDAFTPEQVKAMEARCAEKREEILALNRYAEIVS